ncbi:Synaptic vesicle glycoprotein 2C [Trichoplax sp. H2]|nr:Synaptic vesicle glycoprotein 2C [Trichoplax sp. H2]|eukprot:RDD36368.1 Synaptic vesicle glycoprotein 2C [Trichoplax sp. H2]
MGSNNFEIQKLSAAIESDNETEFSDCTNLLIEGKLSMTNEYTEESTHYKRLTVDDIAESLNCGLFQFTCSVVCGLCFTAEGLIIQSSSIIVMSACDLNINADNRIWLSMSLLIGIAVSSAFWGRLGDSYGRRKVLLLALSMNVVFTFSSAFSFSYEMLVVMAFFNGLGCGGVLPVTLTYAIEFFPRKYRGMAASSSNAYWCFGNIYAALMALLIITQSVAISVGQVTLTGWRIFLIVCAIPPLIALISLSLMPNSPRFLIKQGKREKTLKVLRAIHRINSQCRTQHGNQPFCIKLSDLPTIDDLHLSDDVDDVNDDNDISKNIDSCYSKLQRFLRQYAILYSRKWRKQTLMITVIWFLYCFCTNGLWLWLPTFFSLYTHGQKCQGPSISINSSHSMNTPALNQSSICIANTHDTSIYRDLLLTTFATLIIEATFIPVINVSGRRLLFSGLALATSISIFSIWLTNTSTGVLVFSCLFTGLSGAAWTILNVWTSELYPTQLRSTSNGYINFCGRIGAVIGTMTFGLLLGLGCKLPIIIMGTACFIAASLALFLSDTTKVEIN